MYRYCYFGHSVLVRRKNPRMNKSDDDDPFEIESEMLGGSKLPVLSLIILNEVLCCRRKTMHSH